MLRIFLVATMLLLCQCGSTEKPAPKPASQPAAAPAPPTAAADTRPAIVCFGDSITAGFGLDAGQSFPDLLQQDRSEEHTSELQSLRHLVCRLLLEKKKSNS